MVWQQNSSKELSSIENFRLKDIYIFIYKSVPAAKNDESHLRLY